MPGVPHPAHDGFATHIGRIKQGLTYVSQQQAFPDYEQLPSGTASIVASSMASIPSPGPLVLTINVGVSLKCLVGLSAVVTLDTSSIDTGALYFDVNGLSIPGTYVPLQLGAASASGLHVTMTLGATFLVDGNAGELYAGQLTPGQNTFEMLAQATSTGVFTITAASIWATTI